MQLFCQIYLIVFFVLYFLTYTYRAIYNPGIENSNRFAIFLGSFVAFLAQLAVLYGAGIFNFL